MVQRDEVEVEGEGEGDRFLRGWDVGEARFLTSPLHQAVPAVECGYMYLSSHQRSAPGNEVRPTRLNDILVSVCTIYGVHHLRCNSQLQ
jgi:hypothetical protein